MWDAIKAVFAAEPTVVIGAIGTLVDGLVVLGVTFGLPVTEAEKKAIDGVVVGAGIVITLFVTRAQVTPKAATPPAVKVAP